MNNRPKNPQFSLKISALFLSVCLAFPQNISLAESSVPSNIISIPFKFGTIEEEHSGPSGKTLIYIQDAHDSLEAQKNIAKLIAHLVDKAGVQTVFEEGYEGPVPTDEHFGFIREARIKEKVSYFLMDKLRLGGAEYAHINRAKNFKLIGADNAQLHLDNIAAYKDAAKNQNKIEKDLNAIDREIQELIQRCFSKEFKDHLKLIERFHKNEIDLADYLKRMASQKVIASNSYPNIRLLLSAEGNKNPEAINAKTLFAEINRMENDFAKKYLSNERDRKIFHYGKTIELLRRLNRLEVTSAEYDVLKKSLATLTTMELAAFISKENGKSVMLSARWERKITAAVRFYETARARESAIQKQLEAFKNSDEKTAILVFGGFHKEGIKEILKKDFSYYIVTPKIDKLDLRHQGYYKELMGTGFLPFEAQFQAARAAKQLIILRQSAPFARAEIRAVYEGALAGNIEKYLSRHSSELRMDENVLLARLENEREPEARLEIARQLNLDLRPIKAKLLDAAYVANDQRIKEVINPEDEPLTGVYGGSGADISNYLLSTNAAESYFVDQAEFTLKGFEDAMQDWDSTETTLMGKDYLNAKRRFGHGIASAFTGGLRQIEQKVLLELKAMGVKKEEIEPFVWHEDGALTLKFKWSYPGLGKITSHERKITFIKASITQPDQYPQRLKDVLDLKIDVYYQRAGNYIAQHYNQFLPAIAKSIKPKGFLVLDNIYQGYYPVNPKKILSTSGAGFRKFSTPRLKKYKKMAVASRKNVLNVHTEGEFEIRYGLDLVLYQSEELTGPAPAEPEKHPAQSSSELRANRLTILRSSTTQNAIISMKALEDGREEVQASTPDGKLIVKITGYLDPELAPLVLPILETEAAGWVAEGGTTNIFSNPEGRMTVRFSDASKHTIIELGGFIGNDYKRKLNPQDAAQILGVLRNPNTNLSEVARTANLNYSHLHGITKGAKNLLEAEWKTVQRLVSALVSLYGFNPSSTSELRTVINNTVWDDGELQQLKGFITHRKGPKLILFNHRSHEQADWTLRDLLIKNWKVIDPGFAIRGNLMFDVINRGTQKQPPDTVSTQLSFPYDLFDHDLQNDLEQGRIAKNILPDDLFPHFLSRRRAELFQGKNNALMAGYTDTTFWLQRQQAWEQLGEEIPADFLDIPVLKVFIQSGSKPKEYRLSFTETTIGKEREKALRTEISKTGDWDSFAKVKKDVVHFIPQKLSSELRTTPASEEEDAFLTRLETEENKEERLAIAERLNLDTRPIRAGLLDASYVAHDKTVKENVNPDNKPFIGVYGGSGADISNYLLSIDATENYFVDHTKISLEEFEKALAQWDSLEEAAKLKEYAKIKNAYGHGAADIMGSEKMEWKILLELKAMGIEKSDIQPFALNGDGSITLKFQWAYPEQEKKRYSITFITGYITHSRQYSERLKAVLERGIDVYYQRAGNFIPQDYRQFLEVIAKNIKPGGFLMLDNIHQDYREADPEPYISSSEFSFKKISTLRLEKHRKMVMESRKNILKAHTRGPFEIRYGFDVFLYQKNLPAFPEPVSEPPHSELRAGKKLSYQLTLSEIGSAVRRNQPSEESFDRVVRLKTDAIFTIRPETLEALKRAGKDGEPDQWLELLGLKLLNEEELHLVVATDEKEIPGSRALELITAHKNVYWGWNPKLSQMAGRGIPVVQFEKLIAGKIPENLSPGTFRADVTFDIFEHGGSFIAAFELLQDPGRLKIWRNKIITSAAASALGLLEEFFGTYAIVSKSA